MVIYTFNIMVRADKVVPEDMLRHDQCWPDSSSFYPASEEDAMKWYPHGYRTIKMHGIKHPTVDRWNSFLIGVTDIVCEDNVFPVRQAQDSTTDQLYRLVDIANRAGLYDAADVLRTFAEKKQ